MCQLEKFLMFEKNLMLLSMLASHVGLADEHLCHHDNDSLSAAKSVVMNVTTRDNLTTTDSDSDSDSDSDERASRSAWLVRLWIALQATLCGRSAVDERMISRPADVRLSQFYQLPLLPASTTALRPDLT